MSKFGRMVLHFCEIMGYIIDDQRINSGKDRFTVTSEAPNTCHWIYHTVCTQCAFNTISVIKVSYSYVSSDHLPINVSLIWEQLSMAMIMAI